MANIIKKVFTGRFLGPKYSNNGLYNKSGSDIILTSRSEDELRKVQSQINAIGRTCNYFCVDVSQTEDIKKFCDHNYGISFKISEKVDVNGPNAHPVFKYLKSELKGKLNDAIKWNFTKFLVDRNGVPYKRFSSTVEPEDIKPFIEKLI